MGDGEDVERALRGFYEAVKETRRSHAARAGAVAEAVEMVESAKVLVKVEAVAVEPAVVEAVAAVWPDTYRSKRRTSRGSRGWRYISGARKESELGLCFTFYMLDM